MQTLASHAKTTKCIIRHRSDTNALKDDFHQGYRNRFQATPWDVPNRPPLRHPKPRILKGRR